MGSDNLNINCIRRKLTLEKVFNHNDSETNKPISSVGFADSVVSQRKFLTKKFPIQQERIERKFPKNLLIYSEIYRAKRKVALLNTQINQSQDH